MARINIEDSLFTDDRYQKLLAKTGCPTMTLGLICRAWCLAQKHWLKHKAVPKKAWPADLNILLEIELAERTSTDDVYVKGSKKAFLWLEQKSNAGKSKSPEKVKTLKKTPNARSTCDDRGSNGSEAPSSLLSSLTHKEELGESTALTVKVPKPSEPEGPERLQRIWNENRGGLPQSLALSKKRKKNAALRWKEFPDEQFWIDIVRRMAASDFCLGSTGWRATFDFFLHEDTHLSVNEGKYDNRKKQGPVGIVGSAR